MLKPNKAAAIISVVIMNICFALTPAYSLNTTKGYYDEWGYTQNLHDVAGHWCSWKDVPEDTGYGDFIIAGGLGKSGQHGTWNDEWALVGIIASQMVAHGGYFCPYQLQCNNRYKKKWTYAHYYRPTGYDTSKCAWLCEPGYSGPNCLPAGASPEYCNNETLTPQSGGKFSGISLKTSGEDSNQVDSEITLFAYGCWDGQRVVMLGVVRFLEHGVIAAPVFAQCGRDNWKSNDSYVDKMYIAGTQKLLCAEGYTANSTGTDCEPIDANACELQNMKMCDNFPKSGYNKDIHTIDTQKGCARYFCSEPGYAFPRAGDTSCVECATNHKGGSHPDTGVCVVCETGQYFDSEAGTCKSAVALSKTDLQYGKGKTQNTAGGIKEQCWTMFDSDQYKACVQGITLDAPSE